MVTVLTTAILVTPGTAAATARPTSCPTYEATARQAGFKGADLKKISYIMARESSCFPRAWNKKDPYTGSYCLAQLNGSWKLTFKRAGLIRHTMVELFNPKKCLRAAYWVYTKSGWAPWGTRSSQ